MKEEAFIEKWLAKPQHEENGAEFEEDLNSVVNQALTALEGEIEKLERYKGVINAGIYRTETKGLSWSGLDKECIELDKVKDLIKKAKQ